MLIGHHKDKGSKMSMISSSRDDNIIPMCVYGDGSDVALSQKGVAAFSLSPILLDFSANVQVGFLPTAACGDDTFRQTHKQQSHTNNLSFVGGGLYHHVGHLWCPDKGFWNGQKTGKFPGEM